MPASTSASRRTPPKGARNPYSVHPSLAMVQSAIAQMKTKTGRSLDEWIRFIAEEGPPTEEARRDWLKKTQGLGTNYSGWLAAWSVGKDEEDGDPKKYLAAAVRYVDEMYSGKKAALRPIYDRLLALGLGAGNDAKASPCKTMVPLFREHVFAQIKPSTNTRIDLGLALGAMRTPKRILSTGGLEKKDRITHRIAIASIEEIDGEVERWLKIAYDRDVQAAAIRRHV